MEDWNSEQLARGLEGHLEAALIIKLKDQDVSGSTFLALTANTLKLFDFPMGQILSIMKLIGDILSNKTVLSLDPPSSHNPPQNSSSFGFQVSKSTHSHMSPDESNAMTPSDSEADSILHELIDQDYLAKQSEILLEGYRNRCKRWKRMRDANVTTSDVPYLPGIPSKAWKAPRTKPNLKTGSTAVQKSSKSVNAESCNSSERSDTGRSGCRPTSQKVNGENLSKKDHCKDFNFNPGPGGSQDSDFDDDFLDETHKSTQSKSIFKRSTQASKCHQKSNDDGGAGSFRTTATTRKQLLKSRPVSDDNDDDSEVEGEEDANSSDDGNTGINNSKKYIPQCLPLERDAIDKIHPELHRFDVEKILLSDAGTKKYVPDLKEGYLFKDEKIRKSLFRVIVREICREHTENCNPNKKMKEAIAKSIVVTYPQFQKLVAVKDKTPWSHIYGNNSGNVANIVKRLQRGSLRRKKEKKKKQPKLPSDRGVDIVKLALLLPNDENYPEIVDGMTKSFQMRVKDRENGLSITALIEKYPHLARHRGALINHEFKLMYPDAQDMAVKMQPLIPKVLSRLHDDRVRLKCKDETLKAFMLIAANLPHHIDKSVSFPQEKEIVAVLKTGQSVDEYVEKRRDEAGTAVQPYIIVVTGIISNDILQNFLVLDGERIELGRIPFIRCIDWLFKSCVVFNVHYPSTWRQFFRFLQTCFYNVFIDGDDDVPPSSNNFYARLLSL